MCCVAAVAAAPLPRPRAAPPARRRTAAQPPPHEPFRAGVDLVSLNVTVNEGGTRHYATDLTAEDFSVFEDGVKQDVTFFNRTNLPIALALLIDTSASMESKLPTAQEAAIGFAKRLRPQDLAEVIDFDSRVVILQNVHRQRGRARTGDPQDLGRRIDVAVQRALHRAEGSEEGRRDQRRRKSGARRSSCCPTAKTRRACCRSKRCSTSRSDPKPPSTPSACARPTGPGTSTKGFKEAEFVLRQFAQETGGRAFFPSQITELAERLRADLRRAVEPVHRRLHVAAIPSATAPGGGSSSG